MRVIIGGVRGTSPVAQPGFGIYGGETTALLVVGSGGERVILDAGSGLRTFASRITGGSETPLLLMTHFHLDHLLGLPTLELLYRRDAQLTIATAWRGAPHLTEVLARIFAPPLWVVPLAKLPARIAVQRFPDSAAAVFPHGGFAIRSCALHHPGGSCAYRIDEKATQSALVFATDFEWQESSPGEQAELCRLCSHPRPADLLILEGMYSAEHYAERRGWGHSTWEDALTVLQAVGAARLLITHHDPFSDDRRLREIDQAVQARAPHARLARQEMEITL